MKRENQTVAVLVEQAEGFFKLGDLIVGELIRHFLLFLHRKLGFFSSPQNQITRERNGLVTPDNTMVAFYMAQSSRVKFLASGRK